MVTTMMAVWRMKRIYIYDIIHTMRWKTARKRVKNYELVNAVYDLWALHPENGTFHFLSNISLAHPQHHTATFTFSLWCNIKSLNVSMNVKKRRLTSNTSKKCMQRARRESSMIEIHALLLRCASPISSHRRSRSSCHELHENFSRISSTRQAESY